MEGLKKAFKEGIFEEKKNKKTIKLLWAECQTCKSFDYKWSLVERYATIKKKVNLQRMTQSQRQR
eukprot:9118826-Ditylum_brightwellii.AAC.1